MSAKTSTPAREAALLLAGAMAAAATEPGNAGLLTNDDARPGTLDRALTALMNNEAGKAAGLLHFAVELCAQPVADSRIQEQRTRLMHAASAALALLEKAGYRGPDRRNGEDRRDTSASTPPQGAEQRSGEDRRNPLRNALFKAGNDAWDAQVKTVYELVPLLAVAEFAARAQHSLTAFDFWATRDKPLMERLNGIDPEWRTTIDDALTPLRIAQCVGMARRMAENLADSLGGLSEQAYEACEGKTEGGAHA